MLLPLLLGAAVAAADPAAAPAAPAKAPAAAKPPAATAAAPAVPPGPGRVLDRVAATVNGEVITLHDLEERAGAELRRVMAQPEGPGRDKARARVLKATFDGIVAEKLFSAQVAALGIEVSESEVDQVIDDVKKRNNLDEARLEEALQAQGMDRLSYRQAVKRDLESMRIVQMKIRSKVKVSDEDVRNYWQTHPQEFKADEEVRVRHIFVGVKDDAGAAEEAKARERAERILSRLQKGEPFAEVARQASDGPSAADGGELGWLRRGTVQPDVEKVAFGLQPGQLSQPVRTRAGFQILQVEERRGGGPKPLDEVKEEIRDRLVNEQGDLYRTQFIAELKKDAVIDVKMPELKDEPTKS